MRKSSSVGLGELIAHGHAQETAFSALGQLWSAGLRGKQSTASDKVADKGSKVKL